MLLEFSISIQSADENVSKRNSYLYYALSFRKEAYFVYIPSHWLRMTHLAFLLVQNSTRLS